MSNAHSRLNVFRAPDGDGTGTGGTGGAGGTGGGAPQAPFADANAARGFLKDFVPGEDYLKGFDDAKVMPWATHVKSRVDGFGKQFPEKWRDLVAGEDKAQLKNLEKFASVKSLYDSYNALQQKIGAGELRPNQPFPDKGTPEEQAGWRKLNGVPDKPEDYKFTIPQEMELDDADKGVLQSLQKAAHAAHVPAQHTQAFASWFLSEQNTRVDAQVKKDAQFRLDSEDALRSEWGQDYRPNLNRIGALLDSGPKGFREAFSTARLADGTKLGDNPAALRFLVDMARQVIPAGVVLPGKGTDMAQGVDAEIASIEKVMRENRREYDRDDKMQARLRDLYDARDKLKARKAA